VAQPTITSFVLGDFQTNCFVVTVPDSPRCWIVDCGYEPDPMLDYVRDTGLEPIAMLLTHCHSDHIAGIDAALGRFGPLPIHVHRAELGWCSDPLLNMSAMLGVRVQVTEPDEVLEDGQTLELEGTTWRVVHAPGHSPGSVLFVHDESSQAIVGDTLFAGSIGRFDFPTSVAADLRRTILDVLMTLPDDMTIYPGHGPATTIGAERSSNPFVLHGF
jgi:glyoxylase-like metal-dependent hydrolase (beta-lactamase superfamily II)